MMASLNQIDYNNYVQSNPNMRINRDFGTVQKTTENLYATLMVKDDGSGNKIQDLLKPASNGEVLTEYDRERILFTLDYLRIQGRADKIIDKLDAADFMQVKSNKTASDRADALIQLIIKKSQKGKPLTDTEKAEMTEDIKNYVKLKISSKDNDHIKEVSTNLSLKRLVRNNVRHYGNEIKKSINKCTDDNGNINWEKCYIDVIKYANYASIGKTKLVSSRRIIPIKFSWRNIDKKVASTLRHLGDISKECEDVQVLLAIDYVTEKLEEAYRYYKQKEAVPETNFDELKMNNSDQMRSAA